MNEDVEMRDELVLTSEAEPGRSPHVCTCQQHPPGASISDFLFHFLSSCTLDPLHSNIKKRDSSPKNIAPVFSFYFSLWLQESGHCACAESLLLRQISMLLFFFSLQWVPSSRLVVYCLKMLLCCICLHFKHLLSYCKQKQHPRQVDSLPSPVYFV